MRSFAASMVRASAMPWPSIAASITMLAWFRIGPCKRPSLSAPAASSQRDQSKRSSKCSSGNRSTSPDSWIRLPPAASPLRADFSTFCRHAEHREVWWTETPLTAPRAGRRPVIRHWLRSVDHVRLNLLACGPEWLWAEIWAHILPDDLTGGRDLEEAAVHTLVDEGVAVGQAPGIADERAVKSPFGGIAVAAGILPDDLLLDRIDLQRVRAGEDFEPR